MAKRPIGPFKALDGTVLTCGCCGRQDAFDVRDARLWSSGWGAVTRVQQVTCWNCKHLHWFAR